MTSKFKAGDEIIVVDYDDGSRNGCTGVVTQILEGNQQYPVEVALRYKEVEGGEEYDLEDLYLFEDREIDYAVKELEYDPAQQGDTDEDI